MAVDRVPQPANAELRHFHPPDGRYWHKADIK